MHMPRVSIMLKGTFDHAQFESVCSVLRGYGTIYSSWCSVETRGTNAGAYMYTCTGTESIKADINRLLSAELIQELDVQAEEAHAADCI